MTNGELRRVLLLGPPGSGKGTLAPHLSELLGVPHVSSGQLLRASAAEGDPHRIAEQVQRGHPVPDRVALLVIAAELGSGFILDGFPRNVRQAAELDRLLDGDGRNVQLVL
ncbi:MAG: nucleoside monophosphate kinase, partial [Actinomycetota bacterium]